MDSILTSIKKLHNIDEDDTSFDVDLIMLINSVLIKLTQMGAGPDTGFTISDKTSLWSDFIPTIHVEFVKEYVFLKVKLVFDPPQSSYLIESIKNTLTEDEFRIDVAFNTRASGVML